VALCIFIFLAFFAFNIGLLMASKVLCGLSWGVFQTLSTTYAAEIMPVALRAYLTSNVNLCWLIGQIVGTGVLRGLINLQSEWSYRIPFALQWMWAVPILVGVIFAPESPWWLVRHGELKKAKKALLRLTKKGVNFNADETIQLMKKTNEVEKSLTAGSSYLDCFRGVNLRRTEIACMVWMTQTLCGSPLTGYATYFYVQAGFGTEPAFDLSLGMYGMAIVGAMISWFLLPVVGRRTLYLWGTGLIFVILIIAGSVGTQTQTPWVSWTLGSLVILLTFVYDTTIGPVCYSLVAEIPSTRLRVKTVVLARVAYNIVGLISNVLMPKMLNPTAWNWRGKTCFLWAGTCLLCYIWCYYRLPEPKGLTYLELDLLFEKKVTARKFSKVQNILFESGYFLFPGPDEVRGLNDWRGYTT
jgi:MFS transporter, SP family, general alpha glucoside:H+ symporter